MGPCATRFVLHSTRLLRGCTDAPCETTLTAASYDFNRSILSYGRERLFQSRTIDAGASLALEMVAVVSKLSESPMPTTVPL
jgi:hypothetical protein